MKRHTSKTVYFLFSNRFTKEHLLTISLPYFPVKATAGYYSRLFKRAKQSAAVGFDKSQVSGRVLFDKAKTKTVIIRLSSGFALELPCDINNNDVDIIKHYIEGLRMSL